MKIEKEYINDFFCCISKDLTSYGKIDFAMLLMESRGRYILNNDSSYEDLYIDPKVDILNSNPQVIQQVEDELYEFLHLLFNNNVKSVLQIGLGHFASTHFALSLLVDKICTVEYDDLHVQRYLDEINRTKETIICGDSTSEEVIQQARELGPFDCVFIDGNHSYEYVKKDLENYSELVNVGGIVSLHDANFEGDRYGTPRVIRETNQDWNKISYSKEVGIAYFIKV